MWIAAFAIVAVLAAAAWSLRDDFAYARIATAYAAKQTCSCLHVSGRPLDACLGDFPPEARSQVRVEANEQHVRASVLFGAVAADASYVDGYGCQLGG